MLDEPGYEPLEGSINLRYEGKLNPYISHAESPTSPFRVAGRLVSANTWRVSGCGVDTDGHLWMMETGWTIPRLNSPIPLIVDRDEWSKETASFSGWAVVCLHGDCGKEGPVVFDTTGFSEELSTPEGLVKVPSGSGEVIDYGEEPWSLTAYAIIDGYPGTREDTRVEVDVTWPIDARPGESSWRSCMSDDDCISRSCQCGVCTPDCGNPDVQCEAFSVAAACVDDTTQAYKVQCEGWSSPPGLLCLARCPDIPCPDGLECSEPDHVCIGQYPQLPEEPDVGCEAQPDAGRLSPMCAPQDAGVVNDGGAQDSIEQAPP